MTRSLERYAPLAGVVFLVLAVAMVLVPGETPSSDDSTGKVLRYWSGNDGEQMAASIMAAYAALFLVWFAASLRTAIARVETRARLATLAFAGGVIGAVGLLVNGAVQFAAADSVRDVPPSVTQTLSVLLNGIWYPVIAGIGLMILAAGLAAVRHRVLPRWAAWATLVLGVLTLSPAAWPAILVAPFWVAAVGVALYLVESEARALPAEGAPPQARPTAVPPA